MNEFTHPDAVLKLMGALTGDRRFTEAVNNLADFYEGGNFTMKSFLEKAEAKGIAIGEERVRQSIFQSLLSEGMPRERAILLKI